MFFNEWMRAWMRVCAMYRQSTFLIHIILISNSINKTIVCELFKYICLKWFGSFVHSLDHVMPWNLRFYNLKRKKIQIYCRKIIIEVREGVKKKPKFCALDIQFEAESFPPSLSPSCTKYIK